jgi:hypothetical protein
MNRGAVAGGCCRCPFRVDAVEKGIEIVAEQ